MRPRLATSKLPQHALHAFSHAFPIHHSVWTPLSAHLFSVHLLGLSSLSQLIVSLQPLSSLSSSSSPLHQVLGVGNHSRGQAALPTAMKSFLNDNGYRFDETRPGMITVRPKFRHR